MSKHVGLGRLLEVEMLKKCTPLWREAHLEVKMYKTHHVRTTFGRCDVEKVHAVVAPSTFGSKKCQNTQLDHFWKLRCRRSARRCGAKHILRKNVQVTTCSGHFLTVRLSFDVEKVHAVVARSTFRSKKWQNTRCSDHFWTSGCATAVQKVHAVVARSTFPSQKCQKLRVLSHF